MREKKEKGFRLSTHEISRTDGAEAINDVNKHQTGLNITGENDIVLL